MFSLGFKTFTCFVLLTILLSTLSDGKAINNARAKRSDDVSLTSLKAVLDQQVVLTQNLQAALQAEKNRVTSAESRITALESEVFALKSRVAALSKPVAFTVRFAKDDGVNGIPIGSNSPLRFDAVVLNTGSGYDPKTGIFTAPVAGTYSFFLTEMGVNVQGTMSLAIVKHGSTLDVVYSKDHEDQGSSQVTTHLVKGDQVWVRHNTGIAVRGGWFTVFTGYLLQAD